MKNLTREELRELAAKSTQVVAWYAHQAEVRGPFCRWFECTEVDDKYKHNVAQRHEDCAFAAAAMNHMVPLLNEIDRLEKKVGELELELILMGRIIE